jgi:hypothetical protein
MNKNKIIIAKQNKYNWQGLAIDEAQTEIKKIIRDLLLGRLTYKKAKQDINAEIKECVDIIDFKDLKESVKRGLEQFANSQLQTTLINIGIPMSMMFYVRARLEKGNIKLPAVVSQIKLLPSNTNRTLEPRKESYKPMQVFVDKYSVEIHGHDGKGGGNGGGGIGAGLWDLLPEQTDVVELGVPNKEWDKEYGKRVEKELERLAEQEATDDGFSLRNKAEINVRAEGHERQIKELKEKGVNLVICSSHSNCSKRCEKWQGKYYTLDNTYQKIDNIQFIPLKVATDVYYTTKKGIRYKNGLFGFNCRHYLIEYAKGVKPIPQSPKQVEQQRKLDKRQREIERLVRSWSVRMELFQGVNKEKYLYACRKYKCWRDYYEKWCKENRRVITMSRLKIYPYEVERVRKGA